MQHALRPAELSGLERERAIERGTERTLLWPTRRPATKITVQADNVGWLVSQLRSPIESEVLPHKEKNARPLSYVEGVIPGTYWKSLAQGLFFCLPLLRPDRHRLSLPPLCLLTPSGWYVETCRRKARRISWGFHDSTSHRLRGTGPILGADRPCAPPQNDCKVCLFYCGRRQSSPGTTPVDIGRSGGTERWKFRQEQHRQPLAFSLSRRIVREGGQWGWESTAISSGVDSRRLL